MQLHKEAWKKIQDFNGVWTHDLAITGAMLYQLRTAKGYFKTVEEQVILLQSKVWSNL